jgi:hypothetical protein
MPADHLKEGQPEAMLAEIADEVLSPLRAGHLTAPVY